MSSYLEKPVISHLSPRLCTISNLKSFKNLMLLGSDSSGATRRRANPHAVPSPTSLARLIDYAPLLYFYWGQTQLELLSPLQSFKFPLTSEGLLAIQRLFKSNRLLLHVSNDLSMTAGPMRSASLAARAYAHCPQQAGRAARRCRCLPQVGLWQPCRSFARVRESADGLGDVWFSSSSHRGQWDSGGADGKPPDERTLKLGKTIRVLHDRLPTLLASPLPQDILSPQITLHLFPSTHPHLPSVTGRIAYTAALWTAPVAWGRVPVVGNVRLIITSERMVRNGGTSTSPELRHERLLVRWKTCGKSKQTGTGIDYRSAGGGSGQIDKITEFLGGGAPEDKEFCGLFIFEFDEEGRVASHTIEHAQEGGDYDKMPRVISVTDWLLGKAWRKKTDEEMQPGLAYRYCEAEQRDRRLGGGERDGRD
ncbi:hypothetical protein K402DRAFT_391336 [Aulographum hederae CBS 113979]|uniref:Uncharacterized protein n=1 Tax=Aulographum hederae CBS 113979 TaxID=1176131 RepID=A0A6G1H7P9_9PEZI|nr:hypothetical protein K402DRAFT_391336 [Aulographum hederae CBS 113979]